MCIHPLAFALICLLSGAQAPSQELPAPHGYDLVVVGDVMLGRLVGKEVQASLTSPWAAVADAFPKAQLQIGNFEAVVDDVGTPCIRPGDLCLVVAPTDIPLLKRAGFTHMSLANNHAADLGTAAKAHTRAVLAQHGITALDADWSLTFANIDQLRVALVAISMVPDVRGHATPIPSLALSQKLSLARTLADKVVVVVHWGNELQPWVSQQQRDAADWLIAQGADMIFGHHPHVVQAAECVKGRPVWFSLGNHVFDQKYEPTHTGALAACRFTRDSDGTVCDAYLTHRSSDSAVIDSLVADPNRASLTCTPENKEPARLDLTAAVSADRHTYDLFAGKHAKPGKPLATAMPLRKLEPITLTDGHLGLLMLLELESPFDRTMGLRPHVYRIQGDHLQPLWRGSALAYPIEDMSVRRDVNGKDFVCVLHEPVSHLGHVRVSARDHITLAYRWTGFGFNVDPDPILAQDCMIWYTRH